MTSSAQVPATLALTEQTLPSLLQRQAALGARALLSHGGVEVTYAAAPGFAARWAALLAAAGVAKGDRVCVIAGNSLELMGLWLGSAWLGAVFAPINTAARGLVLQHMLENADPVVLVVAPHLIERVRDCGANMPALRHQWLMDELKITNETVPPVDVGPGDPLVILYTSGTTGPSKGVVCPHAQFFWWGVLNRQALGLIPGDVLYTVLPQFHTNALNSFWQALVSSATYAFGTRFSASQFWRELADARATVTHLLGAMTAMLLSKPPEDSDRAHQVRIALSGATKAETAAAFTARFGVELVDGYGSTEGNLLFSTRNGNAPSGTMGRAFPIFDVRVFDALDQPLPAGTPGELVVRPDAPFAMASGYFRNPEATVAAWRNLWFHTGDRVVCDNDGVFRFLDRTKDAIRRRGENISSFEVERALLEHPQIVKAAVVGVSAEIGDEDVLAWIEPVANAAIDLPALIRFLEPRLPYYAVPRYIMIDTALPLTENGKVKKFDLRDAGLPSTAWDREAHGVHVKR